MATKEVVEMLCTSSDSLVEDETLTREPSHHGPCCGDMHGTFSCVAHDSHEDEDGGCDHYAHDGEEEPEPRLSPSPSCERERSKQLLSQSYPHTYKHTSKSYTSTHTHTHLCLPLILLLLLNLASYGTSFQISSSLHNTNIRSFHNHAAQVSVGATATAPTGSGSKSKSVAGTTTLLARKRRGPSSASGSSSVTLIQPVQPVQPLTSSTKERRLSVQKAWERAQVLIEQEDNENNNIKNNGNNMDVNMDMDMDMNRGKGPNGKTTSSPLSSRKSKSGNGEGKGESKVGGDGGETMVSATPFLDLFTDAGIASVKQVPVSNQAQQQQHTRPRGRPESVPGAMSRATLMNLNDMQVRSNASANVNVRRNKIAAANNANGGQEEASSPSTSGSASASASASAAFMTATSKRSTTRTASATTKTTIQKITTMRKKSSRSSGSRSRSNASSSAAFVGKRTTASASTSAPAPPKKRGRGRPRKQKVNEVDASVDVDEITSIAATTGATTLDREDSEVISNSNLSDENAQVNMSTAASSLSSRGNSVKRRGQGQVQEQLQALAQGQAQVQQGRPQRVKILPKARKVKESEREAETTGMMQPPKRGRRNGDSGDPPNLQRYYRTQLLTQEEEYVLGMKIQFLIQCEHVHEGLYLHLGRAPTLIEWANACGFQDDDPVRSQPGYVETEYDRQIRPVKSEAWEDEPDPNMFVGNGLANDSGPGRGRGRAKKAPPTFLKDYIDDSILKFPPPKNSNNNDGEYDEKPKKKLRKKDLEPINRGTPDDFIDIMLAAREAKQRMVQCNMRLVVSISKRYKHVGVNIADLVQEGVIGLTRAAEKFDPKKGFKFSTYASWWIQQAVFRSIAYHSRTIRLPVHVHNLLNRVRRVRAELKRLHGRSPTNEEMAAEMDMPVEKFIKMLRLTRKAISLDMAKYQNNPKDLGHESDTSLGDTIDATEVMKDENTPQQSVDRTLFRDDLKEMLKILGDDERTVICARYGIEDGLTRTVTTVAAQLGQSKSWVRSQECRALRKLRRPWYEKRLWEHQNSLRG